jgi:hypothetical protein
VAITSFLFYLSGPSFDSVCLLSYDIQKVQSEYSIENKPHKQKTRQYPFHDRLVGLSPEIQKGDQEKRDRNDIGNPRYIGNSK